MPNSKQQQMSRAEIYDAIIRPPLPPPVERVGGWESTTFKWHISIHSIDFISVSTGCATPIRLQMNSSHFSKLLANGEH